MRTLLEALLSRIKQTKFSAIALDHAHEQVNAIVKGQGGAVGLAENPVALRGWMVAGPELSRIIKDFEGDTVDVRGLEHHEQKTGVQCSFFKDVENAVASFKELGNPFIEQGEDLFAIHTKDVKSSDVVETVRKARIIGEEQLKVFLKERFVDCSKPITHSMKKNSLQCFSTPEKKKSFADKAKVQVLKEDCSLFSRLYIACQCRDGNLEDFFKYDNQPWPPSLSQFGKLRGGQKADLVKCLTSLGTEERGTSQPDIDSIILDGAIIVQMLLLPKTSRTIDKYFSTMFAPYILQLLQKAQRIDIVWDIYKDDSLKKSLRDKRGVG